MAKMTGEQLQAVVERLNRVTKSPTQYMVDGVIQVGNYHTDHAFGGVSLCRVTNTGGGASDVINTGHVSNLKLAKYIWAFIKGYEAAKEEPT
jgi:hypothetical protein